MPVSFQAPPGELMARFSWRFAEGCGRKVQRLSEPSEMEGRRPASGLLDNVERAGRVTCVQASRQDERKALPAKASQKHRANLAFSYCLFVAPPDVRFALTGHGLLRSIWVAKGIRWCSKGCLRWSFKGTPTPLNMSLACRIYHGWSWARVTSDTESRLGGSQTLNFRIKTDCE